jgi:hypothetical protein
MPGDFAARYSDAPLLAPSPFGDLQADAAACDADVDRRKPAESVRNSMNRSSVSSSPSVDAPGGAFRRNIRNGVAITIRP